MTNTSTRDEYRGKLLAASKGEGKLLPFNGLEVEFRPMTIDQIGSLNSKADQKSGERLARMIIATAYVPGTDELIFEEGDIDTLKGMPWSPEVSNIQDFFNKMFLGDVEDAEKNSEAT